MINKLLPKVIIADIDGTLCGIDHVLSKETKDVLNQILESNILLGLASGRAISDISSYSEMWGLNKDFDFYIGMNGAQLFDTHKNTVYLNNLMSFSQAKMIFDTFNHFKLSTSFYCDDDVNYIVRIDEQAQASILRNVGKIKFCEIDESLSKLQNKKVFRILFRVPKNKMKSIKKFFNSSHLTDFNGFQTQETCFEVMLKGVNKSEGLKQYCKNYNIALEDVVAFGDTSNDIDMLECCHGVCLKNGTFDAKTVAKDITQYDCFENGMARYILANIHISPST